MTTPPVARKNDRITSVLAGDHATRHTTAKTAVLTILREYGPLNDHGIEQIHNALVKKGRFTAKTGQRLRTARSELYDAGLVTEHRIDGKPHTIRMPSGTRSIVWKATND